MKHQHCDVLILGAGPAGLAAALAAAPSGLRITVVDDNIHAGGQIWRTGPGFPAPAARTLAHLQQHANVQLLSGTRCVMVHHAHQVVLESTDSALVMGFDKLVLCSGARELLLPFPGWTLPGVTGAGGLQALIKTGMDIHHQRVVVAGSGPLLLAVARTVQQAQGTLLRVAEQLPFAQLLGFAAGLWRWPGKLGQALALATPTYRTGSQVLAALGSKRLEAVRIQRGEHVEEIACDRLACGYGLVPNTELAQALGLDLNAEQAIAVDALQTTSRPHCFAAGECTGIGGAERAWAQGMVAGLAATNQIEAARAHQKDCLHWEAFSAHVHRHWRPNLAAVRSLLEPGTVVCRCEDVSAAELNGYGNWTDAKMHTRCGMGPCQGRICAMATSHLWGWSPPRARELVAPARVGSLLGPVADS